MPGETFDAIPLILAALIALGALAAVGMLGWQLADARRRLAAKDLECETERTIARRLGALLDLVPHPVWWRDADHKVGFRNAACSAFIEANELNATSNAATVSLRLAQRALGGGEQTESIQAAVAGRPRLFALTARPLAGGTGAYAVDQTDLETLQADLARQVDANAEVLENLRTAIAIYGADRHLAFANTAFVKLWRLDPDWIEEHPSLGQILEALRESRRLPEQADFPSYKRAQVALFQSLTEMREELLHLPDDTTLRMVVTPHPLGGLMFAYEDVTDSLAMERSYNTLIDVQRETLDNLHEGIAVFGTDGRLALYNPAFARIWNQDREWLAQQPTFTEVLDSQRSFFPDRDWLQERSRILRELSLRQGRHGIDMRADGSQIEFTSVPLPDGGTLFSYLDVTDRIHVERALRERNEALETADRLKTEFIANVSYELRTPLNTIVGFAEILTNQYFGELTPRQREYSAGILESSHRLLSLINDILDLATIEAGYMQLDPEEIDLHTMLANLVALTRERARSLQLQLVFDVPPQIGRLRADPRRLKQAVFNLLTNACNFTPPGGTVTLRAWHSGPELAIAVSDTGVGIAEQDHLRVFGRFERGAGHGRQSGAGLGLSLVKSFIELHGGRVALSSAPKQGTTVTCFLPSTPLLS